MNKPVLASDKIELTALQLVYLLDKAICEAINLIEDNRNFNSFTVAKEVAAKFFATYRKEEQK